MYPPLRPLRPLAVALDQAFFFFVVFLFGYGAIFVCGFGRAPLARYALAVLFCLPLVVVSSVFAAQLSRREPPPLARRDRLVLREICPQAVPKPAQKRAA